MLKLAWGMIGGAPFNGYRFEGTRFDCGDKVGFLHANLAFAMARPDMASEVGDIVRSVAAEI